MAYWGRDDEPMYYDGGRPANDSARREGPPSWADPDVKEDYEIMQELRRKHRRGGDWAARRRDRWG